MIPKPEEYPPVSEIVTAYDRRCFKLYVMLLDAAGVDWHDTYKEIFENCAENNKQHAFKHYHAHLKRTKWITTTGYLQSL